MTDSNEAPADVTIHANHITRPAAWKGAWQVKNLIESKHTRRLLVEGAVLEGELQGTEPGFAFVLKSEVDLNTPWPIRPADD